MNKTADWNVPKWPFLLGDGLLLAVAWILISHAKHPIGLGEAAIAATLAIAGAGLGAIPFILEYRATCRLIEVNGLQTVADKIQQLDAVASQISACTDNWTHAQTQAEKTAAGARQLTDQMAQEVRQFAEFMQRMNDSEKGALRLESDKLRRAEGEWLQVVMRILEHVYALHAAAEQSGQTRIAGQVAQFHNACLDAARRMGLAPFGAQPDEPFNPERHHAVGLKEKPPTTAVIAETVGPGFKYQGKVIRPVLVRLRENRPAVAEPMPAATGAAPDGQLALAPTE